jgi:predicted naringenin-chalcone synthase
MQRYELEAPRLARQAAAQALARAEWPAASIDHLITVSCSGFASPGFEFSLIQELGLRPDVSRTHIGFMGCHGALIGLRSAGMFARAEPDSRVLLCAVELCTLHQQYGFNQERIVANGLFADGAAAVAGQVVPRFDPGWGVFRHETLMLPDSAQCMGWRIGDHGFEMKLTPEVPEVIGRNLRGWLDGWLAEVGLRREAVPTWARRSICPRGRWRCRTRSCGITATCRHRPSCSFLTNCASDRLHCRAWPWRLDQDSRSRPRSFSKKIAIY